MMEYTILRASTRYDLEIDVNKHIRAGWRPVGGVAVMDGAIYQAMIRGD